MTDIIEDITERAQELAPEEFRFLGLRMETDPEGEHDYILKYEKLKRDEDGELCEHDYLWGFHERGGWEHALSLAEDRISEWEETEKDLAPAN